MGVIGFFVKLSASLLPPPLLTHVFPCSPFGGNVVESTWDQDETNTGSTGIVHIPVNNILVGGA